MKNICASTLLLAIVMSSFSFLFSPKVVLAEEIDLSEAFIPSPGDDNDNHIQEYKTKDATITSTEEGGTSVKFKMTIGPGGEVENITWDDDGNIADLGGWYPVYDNDYIGEPAPLDDDLSPDPGDGNPGVYLDIGTTHEVKDFFGIWALWGKNEIDVVDDYVKTVPLSSAIFSNPENFAGGKSTIEFGVIGLELDTQYYAQIRIEEDDSNIISPIVAPVPLDIDSTAYSGVFEFKTAATTTALDTTITTDSGVSVGSTAAAGSTDNGPACFKMAAGVVPYLNIPGCFAQFLYWVWYKPTSFLAGLAAMFLDWFIHFSIQSSTYTGSEFISQGWALVRDISNIVFIFILLYIAIGTILRLPSVDAKKMVGTLVVVALLINFSLFFTKVVIDTSNILANLMYSTISVDNNSGIGDEKTISGALVSQFNPQALFSKSDVDSEDNIGMYIIVTLIAIVMNVLLIMMFLKIGILFVGRIISLMVAMIFSPLAFISMIVPGMKGWKNVGWTNWSSELIKTAFLAPVFLFFLYLIVLFLDLKTLAISDNTSAGAKLLYILIPFAIVYTLLMKAQKVAIDLSGEIGASSMSVMNKVGGFAVGAATGGAALALRGTVGAYAAKQAANPELQAAAAAGDKGAQRKLALANYGAASSFDFRKTKAGEQFGKQTGWDTNTKGAASFAQGAANMFGGKGKVDFATEGGVKAANERKTKARADEIDSYQLKGYAADQQNKKAGDWQKQYEKDLEAALKVKPDLDVSAFKKEYEKGASVQTTYQDAAGVTQTLTTQGAVKQKTAKDINSDTMRSQADEAEYGKGFNQRLANAKEEARQNTPPGQTFDEGAWEAQWRKMQVPKDNLSQSEKQFISDARKKAGEDSKSISPKERTKYENQLNRSTHELSKIDKHLQDIANTWNTDPANAGNQIQPKDVSFDHVEFAMKEGQGSLNVFEAQLKKAEKDVADGTITAQQYAQVKSQYDTTKNEVASYKTLFNDKAQHQSSKSEAQEKLSS